MEPAGALGDGEREVEEGAPADLIRRYVAFQLDDAFQGLMPPSAAGELS